MTSSSRAPALPAVIFVLLVVLVPLGLEQPLLNADGDPARHLTHGLYMLAHGSLIGHDPFSFTRPGAPFLGFEYGSQLLYALAFRVGGLPAVAIFAGGLVALVYGLLAGLMVRRGVDPLLAYIATAIAAALGAGHWVARPHLVSNVAVVLLLGILERDRPVPVWLLAPFFALWANLHGGFVFGWILIGVYLAGTVGMALAGSARPWPPGPGTSRSLSSSPSPRPCLTHMGPCCCSTCWGSSASDSFRTIPPSSCRRTSTTSTAGCSSAVSRWSC